LVQDKGANHSVDRFIASQAKMLKAEEYKEARETAQGDLNGDGQADVVVLYTLENFKGSNLYLQYLAVFLNRAGNIQYATHQVVGGKNRRAAYLKSVKERIVNLDTEEYLPTDASCCPSKKGHTRYILARGKLKEI